MMRFSWSRCVWRTTKAAAAFVGTALVFASVVGVAHAGYWAVSYETSGTATKSDWGNSHIGEASGYAAGNSYAPYVTSGTTAIPPDAEAKSHVNITVKVSADWVADPEIPDDKPTAFG